MNNNVRSESVLFIDMSTITVYFIWKSMAEIEIMMVTEQKNFKSYKKGGMVITSLLNC